MHKFTIMKKFALLSLVFSIIFLSGTNKVQDKKFIKQINKSLVSLESDKLYISKYEVTNGEYRIFLADLKKSGKDELFNECIYDSGRWIHQYPVAHNEGMMEQYHSHAAFEKYPINNISYSSANAYCKWLTKKYNAYKKRKFTNVVFRLPTEEEWLLAAGFHDGSLYPWPGEQFHDNNGTYYANVKFHMGAAEKNDYVVDGGFFTTIAWSYPPSEKGIYNLIGNLSEMIDIKGKAKGGSWNHYPEECTLSSYQTYNGPDLLVGFRWVMEVKPIVIPVPRL